MELLSNTIFNFTNTFVFWAAWIIIPVIMEIIPALKSVVILAKGKDRRHRCQKLELYPEITIIIPVYNSEDSLEDCLRSIEESTYPNSRMQVYCVDNESSDDSFDAYALCQTKFPSLILQWMSSQQGKSNALNVALYNSTSKYIIHIDSDGVLEPHAIENMIEMFEEDTTLNCVTGTILTRPDMIEKYPRGMHRLLRKLEFVEYAQSFLVGRNAASETDSIYTISGAFSAFRSSAILKSWMYNSETVSEDTQITFQMRYLQNERIKECPKAVFLVDPIEDADKLYTQRQRWQRGTLEVANLFLESSLSPHKLFSDTNMNALMYDHTFSLPRFMWYLALFCLLFMGFSGATVLGAAVFVFILYIFIGYIYFAVALAFLRGFDELHSYYKKQWWVVSILPLFNMGVFFIRLAGIINSIGTQGNWKTRTIGEEVGRFKEVLDGDTKGLRAFLGRIGEAVNMTPAQQAEAASLAHRARGTIPGSVLLAVCCTAAALFLAVVLWGQSIFQVRFDALLNTLLGPVQGVDIGIIDSAAIACIPPTIAVLVAIVALLVLIRHRAGKLGKAEPSKARDRKLEGLLWARRSMAVLCAACISIGLVTANKAFGIDSWMMSRLSSTSIFEQEYVDPNDVSIEAVGDPKNLIYIYMESMETTYASQEVGGKQDVNYIPNLTRMAHENVSFSNNEGLGGFYSPSGTTWTMAGMLATSSGIPYAFPVDIANMTDAETFATGLVTIGDILKDKGYTQEFMCGSDSVFGGRELYYRTHGDYEIFDYFTAKERELISEDYKVWWGFEDAKLYEFARQEITRLAQGSEPFNFTMLTVDTHPSEGYVCQLCEDDYPEKTANVVACADRQVDAFVKWIQQQPFADDTLIVITGDHPRMDTPLVDGYSYYERTIYNCLINPTVDGDFSARNREFTHMDMMPTILSALGFDIEGDKLGLGTNLFSSLPTLSEIRGYDNLNQELSFTSTWYTSTFAPEMLENR